MAALSSRDRVQPCGGKVRVVARIRGFRDQELASSSSDAVSVINVRCLGDHDKVAISFDDPTSRYLFKHFRPLCVYKKNKK